MLFLSRLSGRLCADCEISVAFTGVLSEPSVLAGGQTTVRLSTMEEIPMRFVPIFAAAAIVALVSASAMAQTTTTPPAPAGQATTGTNATGTMMKKATTTPAQTSISKACSAQADAKGLHGKARSKFRSECKKNGGKG
jgi:hypothetical protein